MKPILIWFTLVVSSCASVQALPEKPPHHVPVVVFDVCSPDRGEEQDAIRQSKGKAFNSTETACI